MRAGKRLLAPRSATLAQALGSDLLNHWEVPAAAGSFLALDGSNNVSSLTDRDVMAANMTQPTSGNRPAHHSSGGPGGGPYIELQGTGRYLEAGMTDGDNNRIGHYVVAALPDVASRRVFTLYGDLGIGPELLFAFRRAAGASQFSCLATLLTDGAQSYDVASPAFDTGWHLHAFRPLSTGVLWQIDGVTVGSAFTGTSDQFAFSPARIGDASNSGGNVALAIQVDNPTTAKDEAVKAYVRSLYGLTIS